MCKSVISARGRQTREDGHQCEASLGYTRSVRPVKAAYENLVSKVKSEVKPPPKGQINKHIRLTQ